LPSPASHGCGKHPTLLSAKEPRTSDVINGRIHFHVIEPKTSHFTNSPFNTIVYHQAQSREPHPARLRPSGLEATTMPRFIPRHMPRLPFRIPFFRIFYSTTYTVLYFITLVLLAVNPGTMLYTAFDQSAYQYVFEISGVYVLTILLTLFIYLSRLYTNRTVMAGVGKSYIPVEEGEVAKKVRKMITRALERSAIIALESRPRDLSSEISLVTSNSTTSTNRKDLVRPMVGRVLKVDPQSPPWGKIEHPGWSTPSRSDGYLAPHIQFRTVIHELPNLFEAKAVSLAPPDPYSDLGDGQPPLADPAVVELLRRRPHSDLRTYLGHLSQLGLMTPPEAGANFLWQYERARFSCVPLSELQFEDLMESFAVLLSGMQELSPTIIGEVRANRLAGDSTDSSSMSGCSLSSSSRSDSIAGSVRQVRRGQSAGRVPSFYTTMTAGSYDTAPDASLARSPSQFMTPGGRSEGTFRPETAVTHFSRNASTMRRQPSRETFESVGSVLRTFPTMSDDISVSSGSSMRSRSLRSYAGSVIRHTPASRSGEAGNHAWLSTG